MDFPENCKIVDDGNLFQKYESDESWLRGSAKCILIPQDPEAAGAALRWAASRNLDLVLRGAGTGMVGGALPQNSAVMSFEHLDAIHVDPEGM